jgi:hypothetical protein
MTSSPVAAGLASTATQAGVPSRPATFNDHQGDDAARGNCAWGLRRLPHGHVGHVGVRVDLKDRAPAPSKSDVTSLLTGAGFGRRPFPHSRSDARFLPMRCVRKRVCSIPLGQTRAYSANSRVSSTSVRNTLRHQPLVNDAADALHINHRLSSSLFSSGIDPNENGLTHAQGSFAPGAKAYD